MVLNKGKGCLSLLRAVAIVIVPKAGGGWGATAVMRQFAAEGNCWLWVVMMVSMEIPSQNNCTAGIVQISWGANTKAR